MRKEIKSRRTNDGLWSNSRRADLQESSAYQTSNLTTHSRTHLYGFYETKPTTSLVFKQMIREWVLMNESSKQARGYVQVMEGAVCTAVPVPGRALPRGWRGRGVRAGSMGSILPKREPSKRAGSGNGPTAGGLARGPRVRAGRMVSVLLRLERSYYSRVEN